MRQFRIRKIVRGDLSALDKPFNSRWKSSHTDDLEEQIQGKKSYFVAWSGQQPVGHVFVCWAGARSPEPASAFPGVPEIHRLAVLETFQRRGIATMLISECEKEAIERGIGVIGIGTDPDLPSDDNLYIRLGYQDSCVGIFADVYNSANHGSEVREVTQFLIKDLGEIS